jgi:hypothetical protein
MRSNILPPVAATPKFRATKMLVDRWSRSNVGSVRVVEALPEHWTAADLIWPPLRPPDDLNRHWRWDKIMFQKTERLAVLSSNGTLLALWCSGKQRPLSLPCGSCYRLDFFEIAPVLRGGGFGFFCFALAATRAVELACQGLVLAALPGLEHFYTTLGGSRGPIAGWKTPPELSPFHFSAETLAYLKESADEHREEAP